MMPLTSSILCNNKVLTKVIFNFKKSAIKQDAYGESLFLDKQDTTDIKYSKRCLCEEHLQTSKLVRCFLDKQYATDIKYSL